MPVFIAYDTHLLQSLSLILDRTFAGQSDHFLYQHPWNSTVGLLLLHAVVGVQVKEYLHGHEEPV